MSKMNESFFDTAKGSYVMSNMMSRECRYAPAYSCTPNTVYIDDAASTRLGSFNVGDVDKLFRTDQARNGDKIVVIAPTSYTLKALGTYMVSASDIGEVVAASGIFPVNCSSNIIPFNRVITMCIGGSDMFHRGGHKLQRASRDNIRKTGAIVRPPESICNMSADGHLELKQSIIRTASPFARLSVYEHYVSALKTKALSDAEFAYALIKHGRATSNAILQRKNGSLFNAPANGWELWNEIVDALIDGSDADRSSLQAIGALDAPKTSGFKLNMLADACIRSVSLEEVMRIAEDEDARYGWSALAKCLVAWRKVYGLSHSIRKYVDSGVLIERRSDDDARHIIAELVARI